MKNREIISTSQLNYGDVMKNENNWKIAILPWGANEPHGTHLPYLTDTLLASAVAINSVRLAQSKYGTNYEYMVLPAQSIGIHNLGQIDKPYCLNFSPETQYAILNDIVESLFFQGIYTLVIINGHNGNDFKPHVRRLAVEYPSMNIYVCNYLSVLSELIFENQDKIDFKVPEIDDHAAFTETSLMLSLYEDLVDTDELLKPDEFSNFYEKKVNPIKCDIKMWTPRDFDVYSLNNRIGVVNGASKEIGLKMFNLVTEKIADDLNSILIKS